METRIPPAFQACREGKGLPARIRQAESEQLNYGLVRLSQRRTHELVGKTAAPTDPALRCRQTPDHARGPVGQVPILRIGAVPDRPRIEPARLPEMQPPHAYPRARPPRLAAGRRRPL